MNEGKLIQIFYSELCNNLRQFSLEYFWFASNAGTMHLSEMPEKVALHSTVVLMAATHILSVDSDLQLMFWIFYKIRQYTGFSQ